MNRSNLRDNQRKPKGNHSPCAERRFLSPHPGPLSPGEGEACPDRSSIQTRRLFTARSSQFPLPEGEGQGEGKRRELPVCVSDQIRNCQARRVQRAEPEVSPI